MKSVTKWIVLLNSWTLELNVDTGMHKKRKLILCVPKMQIEFVSIQRKIKFNVGPCDFAPTHFNLVPSFPGYQIAQLLIFIQCFFIFVFFGFKFQKKQPHYKRITFHMHPVFHHCVTSGLQSCFSDFRHARSVYSPFLPYRLLQYLTPF